MWLAKLHKILSTDKSRAKGRNKGHKMQPGRILKCKMYIMKTHDCHNWVINVALSILSSSWENGNLISSSVHRVHNLETAIYQDEYNDYCPKIRQDVFNNVLIYSFSVGCTDDRSREQLNKSSSTRREYFLVTCLSLCTYLP